MKLKELQQENQALKSQLATLQGQFNQLLKLINGFKSERFVGHPLITNQPTLFDIEPDVVAEELPKATISYTRTKKKHQGRHKLPEHLPVQEIVIEPEQNTTGLTKIGETVTETLDYTPASLVKRRTIT